MSLVYTAAPAFHFTQASGGGYQNTHSLLLKALTPLKSVKIFYARLGSINAPTCPQGLRSSSCVNPHPFDFI
jgi:hypothetical protein